MGDKFFTPGRTELAGNHTDHQKGRVLAAAVDVGLYAECAPNWEKKIRIRSEGFPDIEVGLYNLDVHPEDFGSSRALVRGVAAAFYDLCVDIGGFDAQITGTLKSGSGLSSSAAFTVMVGKVLNQYYNGGRLEPIVIARAAQAAENLHFGKPCGLMDQLTCALGGCVYTDFYTSEIQPVKADFDAMGLTLCLTDTGGSHAGLDTSYALIPADMRYIAGLFDKGVLAEVDPAEFRATSWDVSDRPVRRAKHFFDENERVPKMRDALLNRDGETYMRLMNESGRSSEKYLNNIITSATGDTKLSQGLELSEKLLMGKGAWRVHGGGFAGCVQALMPKEYFPEYKAGMDKKFGPGKCRELHIG